VNNFFYGISSEKHPVEPGQATRQDAVGFRPLMALFVSVSLPFCETLDEQ